MRESIQHMMGFTTALEYNVDSDTFWAEDKAYQYITQYGYDMNKCELCNIIKELLMSIRENTWRSEREIYNAILQDAQIELDERYENAYEEV